MLTRTTQTMHQPALLTFVVSWLLLIMESNTRPIFSSCSGNVIFVMDASSSIWVVDYRRQLRFVANLVDTFNIGPGSKQVSISAITFSDHAYLDFPLNYFQNRTKLKETILKIPYRTGGTNTALALQLLRNVVLPYVGLKERPLIAVVITDGLSWNPAQTKKEAEELHRLGINMHAIGVGNHYDMEELKAIASDPIHGVHEVTSYSALNDIADKFRGRLCEVKAVTTKKPTTLSTEISPTISSKNTMTATRKRMAENTPMSSPPEIGNIIFTTTEATTLRTVKEALANKPRTTMTSIPSKSEVGENGSGPPGNTAALTAEPSTTKNESRPSGNIATELSTTISSKTAMATAPKRMAENTPMSSTPEILQRILTTTEASTLTTVKEALANKPRTTTAATPSKSELGENDSVPPGNITVGNVTEILQRDQGSTVVFGFDLISMGPSRTNFILQFITYLLPYIGYGKFALVSNTLCSQNFNIPLKPANIEDITQLLHRLIQKKHPDLVDIIRQMNEELFKDAYFKNDVKPKRQIAILFVDPSVSKITSNVLLEADEMKKNGFELFVISIGSVVWTDVEMFTALSSQPHHDFVFSVPTYNKMLQIVKHLPLHFRVMGNKYVK